MGVARKVRTVLKPLKKALEGIAKLAYGEKTRFPVFKGLVLSVAAVAAMLALTCGGLFGGALAFAPMYAGKKFGIVFGLKGAKAGLKKAKTALAKKRDAAQAMAEQLLKEAVSEVEEIMAVSGEVWQVAKAYLVQALETTPDPESIKHLGSVTGVTVDSTDLGSDAATAYIQYWETSDTAMDSVFSALEHMDMSKWNEAKITPDQWEAMSEPVQKAIFYSVKMAKAHCETEPAACAGADVLAGDITAVFNTSKLSSEIVRGTTEIVRTVGEEASFEAGDVTMSAIDSTGINVVADKFLAIAQDLPQLSPEAARDLAKELGLDETVPGKFAQAIVRGDKKQILQLAKDFGFSPEEIGGRPDRARLGARKLQKLLLGLGLEPGDARTLGTATADAMLQRTGVSIQEIVRQETEHFILMEEIRAF